MVTGYLVAPVGRVQFARWDCYASGCYEGAFGLDPDAAREQAAAHVRETGHMTAVERGTRELLDSMATGAAT